MKAKFKELNVFKKLLVMTNFLWTFKLILFNSFLLVSQESVGIDAVMDKDQKLICFNSSQQILTKSKSEKQDIQKIRNLYKQIEEDKSQYKQYQLFKNDEGESFLVDPNAFEIDMEGEQYYMYHKDKFYSTYELVAYFFNDTGELVHIEESSWNSIALNGGGSQLNQYYFEAGSSYPFFIYSYSNSYLKHTQADPFEDDYIISESEKFSENRIYSKVSSTQNQNCPQIIRALTKEHDFKTETSQKNYSGNNKSKIYRKAFNDMPNKKMSSSKLFRLAKLFFVENILIQQSKSKILKP